MVEHGGGGLERDERHAVGLRLYLLPRAQPCSTEMSKAAWCEGDRVHDDLPEPRGLGQMDARSAATGQCPVVWTWALIVLIQRSSDQISDVCVRIVDALYLAGMVRPGALMVSQSTNRRQIEGGYTVTRDLPTTVQTHQTTPERATSDRPYSCTPWREEKKR